MFTRINAQQDREQCCFLSRSTDVIFNLDSCKIKYETLTANCIFLTIAHNTDLLLLFASCTVEPF